jgi:protease I
MPDLSGKNVLMIVAQKGFRDEELLVPRRALESEGAKVTIASKTPGECFGMLGARVRSDIAISMARPEGYDAIIVVGGAGSPEHLWNDPDALRVVRLAASASKVIGAICLSGAVLAQAGVLKGIDATVYETPESVAEMKKGGANYKRVDVVVAGRIITASGPHAAERFANAIRDALRG